MMISAKEKNLAAFIRGRATLRIKIPVTTGAGAEA